MSPITIVRLPKRRSLALKMLCWLPPYCSDLNLIERLGEHRKAFACANKLFASVSVLLDSVRRCLVAQNDFTSSDRLLFLKT